MNEAAVRAFAAGATVTEVETCRELWFRNRRCASCDHAASVHNGADCWMPACGCAGLVRPDQEAPQA
jgi:hypothetical protein